MKKVLLTVLALVLVPFFTLANTSIFSDGSVDVQAPKTESIHTFSGNGVTAGQSSFPDLYCQSRHTYYTSNVVGINISVYTDPNDAQQKVIEFNCQYDQHKPTYDPVYGVVHPSPPQKHTFRSSFSEVKSCPPDTHPKHVHAIFDVNGDISGCADPVDIDNNDSCNLTDADHYILNTSITEPSCILQPDASICRYNPVQVNGVTALELDLEASCYNVDQPTIDPPNSQQPPVGNCIDYNGGLVCQEDPSNVCSSTNSTYGGGVPNTCQKGCGYVQDQFLCFDKDTDGDGVQDNLDPDKDGDGILNEQDPDSDGDGQDDKTPVSGSDSSGGSSGGGGVNVDIDMQGVIDAIKQQTTDLTTTEEVDDGSEISQLFTDKQQELETKTEEYFNSDELNNITGAVSELGMETSFFAINDAISGTSCVNPTHSKLGVADICSKITKIRPYLYIIFGLFTFTYLVFRFTYFVKESR